MDVFLGVQSRFLLEKICIEVGRDPSGLLVEVEAELEQIMIDEVIPGHTQVLTDSVLTGAFPGFDAEPNLLENLVDFVLENCTFTAKTSSNTSIIDIGVLQYCLENDRL